MDFNTEVEKLTQHKFFNSKTLQNEETDQTDQNYSKLPKDTKFRVEALRKLQLTEIQARKELEEKTLQLQKQYHQRLEKSFSTRKKIVNGELEPVYKDLLTPVVDDKNFKPTKSVKGIPNFWFQVLSNCAMCDGWIEEEDKGLLKAIKDVRIVYEGGNDGDGMTTRSKNAQKFVIEFEFNKNEWMSDTILRKTYVTSCEIDEKEEDSPFNYIGNHITEHSGQAISWKKDKCLTYNIIRKKQKNSKTGATRYVTRKEKFDSFFNFFEKSGLESLVVEENDSEEKRAEKLQEIEEDYELGLYFRDRIVPSAVLIFTNEWRDEDLEDDSDEEDSEDDGSEEDDGSDEDSEDGGTPAEKPECKQQ